MKKLPDEQEKVQYNMKSEVPMAKHEKEGQHASMKTCYCGHPNERHNEIVEKIDRTFTKTGCAHCSCIEYSESKCESCGEVHSNICKSKILDCPCHQPSEENKCVCGLEICLGGAEVEIGGVCHRIGSPCYIIEPKISEEKKYIFQKSPSSASSIPIEPKFDELEEFDEIDRAVIFHEDPVSEEKKDWEEEFDDIFLKRFGDKRDFEAVKDFIREKLKEEQEKWRLKNAGLYRQLFGEENRTYTSKELWEILDSYAPLFTEEQKKDLRDNLNSLMK